MIVTMMRQFKVPIPADNNGAVVHFLAPISYYDTTTRRP